MADYKKMYLHLARETTKAIDAMLISLLQCEETYIQTDEEGDETPSNEADSSTQKKE